MKRQLVAGWSLTSACNLKCMHCYNSSGLRRKNELSTEEAYKVADKLKEAGVIAVNFGGGECCLRSDFIPICKYLNNLGMEISYTTNGTCYGILKDHFGLFHDIGVSIDFSDAYRHDYFRKVQGTFEKATHLIKRLVENGVNTEIVTCLTKLNCDPKELEKIYSLAQELGVDYWRLNRFRANGRGIDNKSSLALQKEDLKIAYEFLSKKMSPGAIVPEPIFRAAFGGSYSFEGDPSGFTAFRIQPNGEVTPSVFLKESGGNIKEKSIEDIFGSPIFQAIRDKTPVGKCSACPSYYHCRGGDAGASFLQFGHFNGPDPLCWLEPSDKHKKLEKIITDNWNVHEKYLCTVYIKINERDENHE